MQFSEVYISHVDNTYISNIVLIRFKSAFSFLHLVKISGYQKFSGVFRGIEMEH